MSNKRIASLSETHKARSLYMLAVQLYFNISQVSVQRRCHEKRFGKVKLYQNMLSRAASLLSIKHPFSHTFRLISCTNNRPRARHWAAVGAAIVTCAAVVNPHDADTTINADGFYRLPSDAISQIKRVTSLQDLSIVMYQYEVIFPLNT